MFNNLKSLLEASQKQKLMLRSLSDASSLIKPITSKQIIQQLSFQKRSSRQTIPKLKQANSHSIDVVKPYYYATHQPQQFIKTQKVQRNIFQGQKYDYLRRKKIENRTKLRRISRNLTTQILNTDTVPYQGWKQQPSNQHYLPSLQIQRFRTDLFAKNLISKKSILRNSANNSHGETARKRIIMNTSNSNLTNNDLESLVNMVKSSTKKLSLLNNKNQQENMKLIMSHLKIMAPDLQKTRKYGQQSFSPKRWQNIEEQKNPISQNKLLSDMIDEELEYVFPNSQKQQIKLKISRIMTESPYKETFIKRISSFMKPIRNTILEQKLNKSYYKNYQQKGKYISKSRKNKTQLNQLINIANMTKLDKNNKLQPSKFENKENNQQKTEIIIKNNNKTQSLNQQHFQSSSESCESLLNTQPYLQCSSQQTKQRLSSKQSSKPSRQSVNKLQNLKLKQRESSKQKLIRKQTSQQNQNTQNLQKDLRDKSTSKPHQKSIKVPESKQELAKKQRNSSIRKSKINMTQINQLLLKPPKKSSLIHNIKIDQVLQFQDQPEKLPVSSRNSMTKKTRVSKKRSTITTGKSNSIRKKSQFSSNIQQAIAADQNQQIKEEQQKLQEQDSQLQDEYQYEQYQIYQDEQEQNNISNFHRISNRKRLKLKLGQGLIDNKGINMIKQELQKLKAKPIKIRRVGKLLNAQKIKPIQQKPQQLKSEQIMRDFLLNLKKKKQNNRFSHENIIPTQRSACLPQSQSVQYWALSTAKRQIINLMAQYQNCLPLKQLNDEIINSFGKLQRVRAISILPQIPPQYQMNTIMLSYHNIYDNLFQKHDVVNEPNYNIVKRSNFIIDSYLQNEIIKSRRDDEISQCEYVPHDVWELYQKDKQKPLFQKQQDILNQTNMIEEGNMTIYNIISRED